VKYLDAASFRVVAFEVFVRGEYLFRASRDAPVIFDCGANIGLATLFFKRLYPKAQLHAFEADPSTAEVLRKNVEQNHLLETVVSNVLLTDHEGSEKFYLPSGTSGSLMMSTVASRFSSETREVSVPAGRLSTYIEGPVDLLKLDVEGSELAVIRDLVASGKIQQIERIFIEYHHKIGNEPSRLSGFLALLEESGYEYHLEGKIDPTAEGTGFQDIVIHAYQMYSVTERLT
jgi:FkbM family methyltransferase